MSLHADDPIEHNLVDLEIVPTQEEERSEPTSIFIREMGIDDLAPVFHFGEELFTSDLYPSLYRIWDEWAVIGFYNTEPEYCLVAEADSQVVGFILGTLTSSPR
ncbi:tll2200 [Thermosynechococcus vestitus BP-1]|uniref:Tll2200 protein n=1 Tax=Thermosynechococcus vestitus (strain NIES-2133 / IAM M-273 / BP-1) TaxID=197221 RepID=Q8DGW2_THEVB|nr:hypothetical protein [Thermosynechococcus vestitus]BAC09752.1 tll2200 [Thermosynechococcus vestitus BP-1]